MNEAYTVQEHNPDYWVLVIPVDPSPDKIDYFSVIEKNVNFKMVVIPLTQIQEILYRYPELKHVLLYGSFPDSTSDSDRVKRIKLFGGRRILSMLTLRYENSTGFIYVVNENGLEQLLENRFSSEPNFSSNGRSAIYITKRPTSFI